jgi:hypothetical protein
MHLDCTYPSDKNCGYRIRNCCTSLTYSIDHRTHRLRPWGTARDPLDGDVGCAERATASALCVVHGVFRDPRRIGVGPDAHVRICDGNYARYKHGV